jgi:hypothetical protein
MRSFVICKPNIGVTKQRRVSWGGGKHVAFMGEVINAYKILIGIPEDTRPLG